MSEPLGCAVCRVIPASRGELRLIHVQNLFEDSHEGYALLACPDRRQPFLYQFQEITWLRWMPITAEELAEIERLFPEETEDDANAGHLAKLMHARGRLVRDPDGRFAWSDPPWDAGNLYPPG